MKAISKSTAVELSYFRLSLLSYLRESHPDKAADKQFIASRGDAAAEAYSNIIKLGGSHDEAEEIASQALYAGLHFSPYRAIVNILWDEFADEIDPAQAEGVAMELLPRLSAVIKKYTLSDDFADSQEYNLLYTELTGAIQTLLEDGIQ
jgi:predicted TPR repeat methyltransferase